MRCQACGDDNLTGAEVCDNCGADLAGNDVPQATTTFQGRLLGEHLDELGAPPPLTVGPDTPVEVAITRMHDGGADCVLVTVDDRLVGIFTDRDAVVKAAGKPLDGLQVRDFMTPDPVVLATTIPSPSPSQDGGRRVPSYPDHRGRSTDRRGHGSRRLPPPRGDARLTARIAILADDLIWATRLADLVRGAGPGRRAADDGRADRRAAGRGPRDRRPHRAGVRRDPRDRRGACRRPAGAGGRPAR